MNFITKSISLVNVCDEMHTQNTFKLVMVDTGMAKKDYKENSVLNQKLKNHLKMALGARRYCD